MTDIEKELMKGLKAQNEYLESLSKAILTHQDQLTALSKLVANMSRVLHKLEREQNGN